MNLKDDLPKRESFLREKKEVNEFNPSLITYGLLFLLALSLIVSGFLLDGKFDLAGLLINLSTEIFGAILILLVIDKKFRRNEVDYLKGSSQKAFEKLMIFLSVSDTQVNSYIKRAGLEIQQLSDDYYLSNQAQEQMIFSHQESFVLTGGPGVGKTTILQKLFINHLRNAFKSPRRSRVPVFVNLLNWKGSLDNTIWLALQDKSKISERTYHKLLRGNRLICIFDGLDGVLYPDIVLEEITAFHKKYPSIQLITSTREMGILSQVDAFKIIRLPNPSEEERNKVKAFMSVKLKERIIMD